MTFPSSFVSTEGNVEADRESTELGGDSGAAKNVGSARIIARRSEREVRFEGSTSSSPLSIVLQSDEIDKFFVR